MANLETSIQYKGHKHLCRLSGLIHLVCCHLFGVVLTCRFAVSDCCLCCDGRSGKHSASSRGCGFACRQCLRRGRKGMRLVIVLFVNLCKRLLLQVFKFCIAAAPGGAQPISSVLLAAFLLMRSLVDCRFRCACFHHIFFSL